MLLGVVEAEAEAFGGEDFDGDPIGEWAVDGQGPVAAGVLPSFEVGAVDGWEWEVNQLYAALHSASSTALGCIGCFAETADFQLLRAVVRANGGGLEATAHGAVPAQVPSPQCIPNVEEADAVHDSAVLLDGLVDPGYQVVVRIRLDHPLALEGDGGVDGAADFAGTAKCLGVFTRPLELGVREELLAGDAWLLPGDGLAVAGGECQVANAA